MESLDFGAPIGVFKKPFLPKGRRGGTYILYGAEIAKEIIDRISVLTSCRTEKFNNILKSSVDYRIAQEIAEEIWETGRISHIPNTYEYANTIIVKAFEEERYVEILKAYIYYRTVINPKFKTVNRKIKKVEELVEVTPDNILSFYSIANFREEQRDFVIKGLIQLITSFQKDIIKILKCMTFNTYVDGNDIVIYDPRKEDVYMSLLHGERRNEYGNHLLIEYARLKSYFNSNNA